MKIEYAVDHPEKPHVLHAGLRYELAIDGMDLIRETPVRKRHYYSLPVSARLPYVMQCAEYHHPHDPAVKQARREAWDSNDRAADQARFCVRAMAFLGDRIAVEIKHHGLVYVGGIAQGASSEEFEANCRNAFATYEAQVQTETAALNAYNISK